MKDHKEEAERLIDGSYFAEAQVHATLYLAEQQRIANLIALLERPEFLLRGAGERGLLVPNESDPRGSGSWAGIVPAVRIALGLEVSS